MKNENHICGETDKTGKLTLDTIDNNSKKMKKHIRNDKSLNENAIRKSEGHVNTHIQFWSNILKPGENNKQLKRVKGSLIMKDNQGY